MEREFGFTQSDFNKVRTILVGLTGIKLADSKESLVYSRLTPRIRKLGLKSTKEYLKYLENHNDEQENFINALTTNLTSFYREPHHLVFWRNSSIRVKMSKEFGVLHQVRVKSPTLLR